MQVNRDFYVIVKTEKSRIFLSVHKRGQEHRIFRCNFDKDYFDANYESIMTDIVTYIIDRYVQLDAVLRSRLFRKIKSKYTYYVMFKYPVQNVAFHLNIYLASNKRKSTNIKRHFDRINYQAHFFVTQNPFPREQFCNYQGSITFKEALKLDERAFFKKAVDTAVKKIGL
jgi:hypothetical protein